MDSIRYNVNRHNDAEIAAKVDKEIPEELISSRSSGGNSRVSYLKGDISADKLNEIFGPLGWGVVAGDPKISRFEDTRMKYDRGGGRNQQGREVEMVIYAVTTPVTLTIKARTPESTDTIFTQTGVGYGEVEPGKHAKDAIAMAVKGAETDGLKRCVTLLGKAFGMFLNADGTQDDISYAHANNADGLKKARAIRKENEARQRTESSNSPRERAENDGHEERTHRDREARPRNREEDRNSQRDKAPDREERRPQSGGANKQNETKDTQHSRETHEEKRDDSKPEGSKRPTAPVNDKFDLESEPVTRDDQVAYGATFVKKLNSAETQSERLDLVKKYRKTLLQLDIQILNRVKSQAQRHDIDIDKVKN